MILDSHCCEKDMPSQMLEKNSQTHKRATRRGRNKVSRRKTATPTNVIKQKASSVARKPILLCHICFVLCCGHKQNVSDKKEGLLTFPDFLEAVCHCARIIVQSTAPAKIAKVRHTSKVVKKKSVEDEFSEGLLFVLECLQSIDLDAVISASKRKDVHELRSPNGLDC